MAKKTPQEVKDRDLIKWIMGRKESYYKAQIVQAWMEQGYALQDAIDLRYNEDDRHMTRSKFHVADVANAFDAQVETATSTYGQANPLFVHMTRRTGQMAIAEKHQFLANTVWDRSDGLLKWMEIFRYIPIYGMGVAYVRWAEEAHQGSIGIKDVEGPWGSIGLVAEAEPELMGRAEIEVHHPFNWWGYWRTSDRMPPWEGLSRLYSGADLEALVGDATYDQDAVKAEIAELKKGGTGPDDDYYVADDDEDDIADMATTQFYEYWGSLYGAPGHERDTREYVVLLSGKRIIRKNVNRFSRYRPIHRAVAMPVNDWACGRPTLLNQLPSMDMKNLSINLSFDEWLVRLHHGVAIWEEHMENPDEFLNPIGPLAPIRMKENSPKDKLPMRIDQGGSMMLRDAVLFNEKFIEPGRQASSMDDVLSFKSGVQDGTARAADLVAQQGSRKGQSAYINAGETGMLPIGEQMVLLTLINSDPEQLSLMTRDGKPVELTEEDKRLIIKNNFLDLGESVRRDQFIEAKKMEALLEKAAPHLQNAQDPDLFTRALRKWAGYIGIDGYDEWLPLNSEFMEQQQQGQAPQPGQAPPGIPQEQPVPDLAEVVQ